MLHIAESLHVVDDGRALIKAKYGGEIGRLDPRIGPFALQGFYQSGFFAANVGTCTAMNDQIARIVQTQDLFTTEALFLGLGNGSLQNAGAFEKLGPNVNESLLGLDRISSDHHALDKLMRILVNDLTILESSRFGLVGIADQIDRFA